MAAFDDTPHNEFDDDYQSKSHFKREADQRQALGEALVNLGTRELEQVPLDETLLDAIALAHKIRNKHEAYRRQLQFIGKLMRSREPQPILQALEQIRNRHGLAIQAHHQLEQWRDRLLAEGDPAIDALLAELPQLDRQQLRKLVRQAQAEQKRQQPPKSARLLFRLLREAQGE